MRHARAGINLMGSLQRDKPIGWLSFYDKQCLESYTDKFEPSTLMAMKNEAFEQGASFNDTHRRETYIDVGVKMASYVEGKFYVRLGFKPHTPG